MAVWAGMKGYDSRSSLDPFPVAGHALGGTNIAENELSPYIQQAADQVYSQLLVIS